MIKDSSFCPAPRRGGVQSWAVVDGQRKKGRLKKMWMMQVEEESMKVGLSREDALC